jgi:hypothetical protein
VSWTTDRMPEARADGLLTEQVGDEVVVYDTESKDVHCLSPLAAAVFEHCDGRSDPAAIAESVGVRLGRPVTKGEVSEAIAQLEERSLLERPPLLLHQEGVSRRDLAKKTARVGAAVASVPLITSIVAPTAAMAATQIPSGCGGCGQNSDCVSNHCCQNNAGKQCNEGCCVNHDNSCHFCNCVGTLCECTVDASDIPGGVCPCLCSAPGCTATVCCTTSVCCTPTPAC